MRKTVPDGRLAQKLLALVTPPDRAESAVGDLLEQAESRGDFWFWRSVAQMTVAHALTTESRRQWTMLPALLDTTVLVTLIFFLIDSMRGVAIIFASIFLWSYICSSAFPALRANHHARLRLAWSFGWLAMLWAVFR